MSTPALFWFASFSNITSIAVVTLCFIAMAIFIGFTSFNADFSSSSHARLGVAEQNMVKVTNPFFLSMENSNGSLQDGLKAIVSSLCSGDVFVLWGPRINPLHDLILKPGTEVRRACRDVSSETFQELDVLDTKELRYPEPGEHMLEVPCPTSVSCEALGSTPRKRYPVVVFTFIPERQNPCHVDLPDGHHSSLSGSAALDRDDTKGSNISSEGHHSSINESLAPGTDDTRETKISSEGHHSSLGGSATLGTDNTQDTNIGSEGHNSREDPNCIIGLISIIHLRDQTVRSSSHVIHQYIKTAGVPLYSLQPLYMASTDTGAGEHNSDLRQGQSYDPPLNQSPEPDRHDSCDGQTSPATSVDQASSGVCVSETELAGRSEERISSEGNVRRRNVKCCERGVSCEDGDERNPGNAESCDSSRLKGSTDRQPFLPVSQPECVVCQTRPALCVILPCRHTCVCFGCFKLIDRCPMCRGQLESFFLLSELSDEEAGDEVLEELNQQAMNASLGQVWERINDRLNDFFGYR